MIKKGFTLIELVVAMTIFITVMTLAIGGFITILRSRMIIGNMKDSQQKIRVVSESISRFAKEAEYVQIPTGAGRSIPIDGDTLVMYFDSYTVAKKFKLVPLSTPIDGQYDLQSFDCVTFTSNVCTTWGTGTSLLGTKVRMISDTVSPPTTAKPVFKLSTTRPYVIELRLEFRSGASVASDSITINNAILLEGLK